MSAFTRCLPVLLWVFLLCGTLDATPESRIYKVATHWPGIQMQVIEVKRIGSDRILVLVRLEATAKSPATTSIEAVAPAQHGAAKDAAGSQPFSLAASTMTDDKTDKKYPVLAPDPQGMAYAPTEILTQLSTGQSITLSVQFQVPNPEPKDGKTADQTVTLTLPNATEPIRHIPVPANDPESKQ